MDFCGGCCIADENKEVIVGIKAESVPGRQKKVVEVEANKENVQKSAVVSSPKQVDCLAEKPVSLTEAKTVQASKPPFPLKEEAPTPSAPSQDALPAPRRRTMNVSLTKGSGQELGLDVDFADKVLLKVVKIKPGLVEEWNKAHPEDALRPKDEIVSVNGKSGNADELVKEISSSQKLELMVRRSNEIDITIVKAFAEQPIGLDIDGSAVKVLKVKDGPMRKYNESLQAGEEVLRVGVGDKLVKVNDATSVAEIVKELKAKQHLSLRVLKSGS
eukprot:TRINITY_DN25395_c0_g1_i1.p1 TRINITY_DN25395_c0_g1~~TRINITY_DN25395_c0_g1_i1.p1  ORF type:complete len:273 (+),score=90.97 TRINITY_DN25395_c0_g1_i1:127-945(+)